MRIKNLEFEEHPRFIVFQFLAFIFGILQSSDHTLPWLNCNFIRCEGFSFATNDIWLSDHQVFIRNSFCDNPQSEDKKSLINEIKKQIDDNYYINGLYDEFYDPNKWSFHIQHFPHDFLLTGYDDNEQAFTSFGYTNNKIFQKFRIHYNDFYNAVSSDSVDNKLFRMRINPNKEFNFNLLVFSDELYSYIKQPLVYFAEPINGFSGIASWNILFNHVKKTIKCNGLLNLSSFRFMLDHSFHLLCCLKYIKNQFEIIEEQCSSYNSFCESVRTLFNLCIKYNVKKDREVLFRIQNQIQHLYNAEFNILNEVQKTILDMGFSKIGSYNN